MKSPNLYLVNRSTTVEEALAQAGGFRWAPARISVSRHGKVIARFVYALNRERPQHNIQLHPGDILLVK